MSHSLASIYLKQDRKLTKRWSQLKKTTRTNKERARQRPKGRREREITNWRRRMSWQTYVDDHLMCDIDGTGHHLTAAAIVGHDGSVWAQSSSFPQVDISISSNQFLLYMFFLYTLICSSYILSLISPFTMWFCGDIFVG